MLEGYATALAAPSMDENDLASLVEINDRTVEATERVDSLAFGRLDQEFHPAELPRVARRAPARPMRSRRGPKGEAVVPGLVTSKRSQLESKDDLERRSEQASR